MAMNKEVVGLVVGGGPAPGINGVISAVTIEAINHGKKVVGIVGGFNALFDGKDDAIIPLTIEDVSRIHNTGGSILRTSRGTPEEPKEKFKTLMAMLKRAGIRYLVSIGGEGSLFVAHWIEKEARGTLSVVHVPKTIDNDIPLPGGFSTFGYQTARHVGVEIVQNLMEDARTMGRWYFISTMGRHAGHLALGIGKAAGVTITLIPEEFPTGEISLQRLADILAGSVIKRLSMGKDHGVAVFAEGISERLNPDVIQNVCGGTDRDPMGRIRLSEIPLASILKESTTQTLKGFGIHTTIVGKDIGYELRAANPIPFDIEYTRNLGYGAIHYLLRGGTGSIMVPDEGYIRPVPFVEMFDYHTGEVKIRTVDIQSETYEVAREYMIRLEKPDLEGERLKTLAKVVNLTPEQFREHFSYVV
jgi:ATP-dependent phosphofructokinase / diphosphate-dependent phosphofructokinase